MTKSEFHALMMRLYERGALSEFPDDPGATDILEAVPRRTGQASASPKINPTSAEAKVRAEATGGRAILQDAHLTFFDDPSANGIRIESAKLPVSSMVYIGCVKERAEMANWKVTKPTPFHRVFQTALEKTNAEERTLALVAVSARLSWGIIAESVLREANRSARSVMGDRRNFLIDLVASQYPGNGSQDAPEVERAAEPDCETGDFRGMFVVLRDGGNGLAVGRMPTASFHPGGPGWLPVWKMVHFAAEVEVAPNLLVRSVQEAMSRGPASAPAWRTWIKRELADNPALHEDTLALLPP